MTHTVIARYDGIISRKDTRGIPIAYHHFTHSLKYKPLPDPGQYSDLFIPLSDLKDFLPEDIGKILLITEKLV